MSHRTRILILILALGANSVASAVDYRLETWAEGLSLPWSIAFLPGGGALVTELGGTLRRLDASGRSGEPLDNVPPVYFAGQGGLFDVVLHPEYETNSLVYISYAEGSPENNGTAIARGRLEKGRLESVEIVFRNFTRKDTPVHYGGRMAFLEDGSLLLTTGDGFDYREAAQDIDSGLGKVLRMNDDGTPAPGNPFGESPYVYSYGLRNPQGLAVDASGTIWLHDHGPRGGDELNIIRPGVNYGWPAVTHGTDYTGALVSPYTELDGMASPLYFWVPSIAPSGLTVYEADLFPAWTGDLFLGALVDQEVRRLEVAGERVLHEQVLFSQLAARIRDVRTGPDGALYILTPDRIIRVASMER